MPNVAKSVTVKRPAADVIEYIADVRNHPAFIGPLKSVDNLSGDPRKPGTTWTWSFVMGGVELTGSAETVDYKPGELFSYRTSAGADSTFVYKVDPHGGADTATVSLKVDYAIPGSVLGRLSSAVVERLNDVDAQRAVDNLKVILDN